jgi:hypothetical protein
MIEMILSREDHVMGDTFLIGVLDIENLSSGSHSNQQFAIERNFEESLLRPFCTMDVL